MPTGPSYPPPGNVPGPSPTVYTSQNPGPAGAAYIPQNYYDPQAQALIAPPPYAPIESKT